MFDEFVFLSPRASSVLFCLMSLPAPLLTSVTLIISPLAFAFGAALTSALNASTLAFNAASSFAASKSAKTLVNFSWILAHSLAV